MSKVVANFGRLWGHGYEKLGSKLRRILSVKGPGATSYLQGLVTCDLTQPPRPPTPEPIGLPEPWLPKSHQSTPDLTEEDYGFVTFDETLRSACFLDSKGRIVTDSLLWKINEEQYFIDAPASSADSLLEHLKRFKLRRTKVEIEDKTSQMSTHVVFGSLNAEDPPPPPGLIARMDPRHPSLGMRLLENSEETEDGFDFAGVMKDSFPDMEGNYEFVRRLAGVAEGSELTGQVALQANQDFLNAVSFHKGCYLGQELTARVQHTGAIRKRILPLLLLDKEYEVPRQWRMASDFQRGRRANRYSPQELERLPPRQPRLSASTVAQFVMLASGGVIDPDRVEGSPAEKEYGAAQELMETLQDVAVHGAKITDTKDGSTIGKILTPPMPGTNAVTALCRLESMALMGNELWEFHNKVKIGDSDEVFRYLPYIPFWWPALDPLTGKAAEPTNDKESAASDNSAENKENFWEATEAMSVPPSPPPSKKDSSSPPRPKKPRPAMKQEEATDDSPSIGLMTGLGALGKLPPKEEFEQQQFQEAEDLRSGKTKVPHTPKTDWFTDNKRRAEPDGGSDRSSDNQ